LRCIIISASIKNSNPFLEKLRSNIDNNTCEFCSSTNVSLNKDKLFVCKDCCSVSDAYINDSYTENRSVLALYSKVDRRVKVSVRRTRFFGRCLDHERALNDSMKIAYHYFAILSAKFQLNINNYLYITKYKQVFLILRREYPEILRNPNRIAAMIIYYNYSISLSKLCEFLNLKKDRLIEMTLYVRRDIFIIQNNPRLKYERFFNQLLSEQKDNLTNEDVSNVLANFKIFDSTVNVVVAYNLYYYLKSINRIKSTNKLGSANVAKMCHCALSALNKYLLADQVILLNAEQTV
jgi:ribosomal protein L37AE/L43A